MTQTNKNKPLIPGGYFIDVARISLPGALNMPARFFLFLHQLEIESIENIGLRDFAKYLERNGF